MAARFLSRDHADEDYINIEVSSHNNTFGHSISSPPHPREFEFQMFSSSSERDTNTSPADELFYKGKLLPLHLPPRLQMVKKLLQNSNSYDKTFDEYFSTPLTTNTTTTPASNTPFESCNISPSESCQVSRELNPDEYFFEYSTEGIDYASDNPKKSWTTKLKLIKQTSLGSKLKASRAYLKSLFSKSGCSDESAADLRNMDEVSVPKAKGCAKNYVNVAKKNYINVAKKTPFGQIQKDRYQSFNKERVAKKGGGCHRRSFSGAIKWLSTTKPSSSSCSSGSSSSSSLSNLNGFHQLQSLKRSSSSNSELESSIQSAIAHCKRSQQQFQSGKTVGDMRFCSISASIIVHEDHERQGLCRG